MTPPSPRSPWAVLASTSLAVFAVFLDTTILFVAFPAIRADFSEVSPSTLSWVLNAYTIVFAALLIPAGRLADRIGRRRTFLAAAVLFTVASMLCGLAPTAGLLVAARILQAVGAAALVPSSLALVLQTFPRSKIPVAVAIWGAVGAVAGAAGPTLGAFVVESFGWRWAFFINLPVGIVSYFVGRRVLYSWIGATRRDWRGQGHFRALTEQQEVWAIGAGFDEVVVKTKNRFFDMRGTLDTLGFEVVKFERSPDDNGESKVYLSKRLGPAVLDSHRSVRTVVRG